jgi:CheY-like chemotaxis protein
MLNSDANQIRYRVMICRGGFHAICIRETSALILMKLGYEVRTSADGFQALVELRSSLPDLIVCDLRMPNMSGFELLSVVRRRFPHIPIIAISGEFLAAGSTGLLADAFFSKGQYKPDQLAAKIAELIERSPLRAQLSKADKAPIWIPINDRGYFVLTCTECPRSFSLPHTDSDGPMAEAECPFCESKVNFLREI